jgi:hypothetical protein
MKRAGLLIGVLIGLMALAAGAQDRGPAGGGSGGGGGPTKGIVADPFRADGFSLLGDRRAQGTVTLHAVAYQPRDCSRVNGEPRGDRGSRGATRPGGALARPFALRLDDGAALGRAGGARAVPVSIPCLRVSARI